MNPQFEDGEDNFNLQGNSPAIDAGDPTDPYDPDGTIADQGALPFDHNAPHPDLYLNLEPMADPIYFLPQGGQFTFDLELWNIAENALTTDVWTEVELPNGSFYGPLLLREDVELPSDSYMSRNFSQIVPGTAPGGWYYYWAYIGTYPDQPIDEDSFMIIKYGTDSGNSELGDWALTGWEEETVTEATPREFNLSPAYPNPFNPETNLTFSLPADGHVSLVVYDTNGRQVATLYNGFYSAGIHHATFGVGNLPSGVYIVVLTSGTQQATQKLLLVK